MSSAIYDALARSKLLGEVERAFRNATGLSLKLVPSVEQRRNLAPRGDENPFCALMATSASACAACVEVQRELQRRLGRKLTPQEICCFAGMVDLAVPVLVGGKHAATLLGGQVFRQKPTRRQFERAVGQLRKWGMHARLSQIKKAYFNTNVVSEKQFQGAVQLLTILAAHLGESANRYLLAAQMHEPPAIKQAKSFVHAQASERVTLRQTAAHVNVSSSHFCKLFKHATGMTFTAFVARVRVEKAKELLSDLRLRITDVAASTGFNSISQFNRVFRRYTGNSPTAHRTALLRHAGLSS